MAVLIKERVIANLELQKFHEQELAMLDSDRKRLQLQKLTEEDATKTVHIQRILSQNWDLRKDHWEKLTKLVKDRYQLHLQKQAADHKNKWYNDFSLLHYQELQQGVGPERRWHCYSTGWDTDLFAAIDLPSNYEDECSICTDTLRTGKVRKLPCDHIFHLPCIKTWLEKHDQCPHCRRQYKILRPPKWGHRGYVGYSELKYALKDALKNAIR
ncbi:hypothetical protein EG329_001556 [Mollisiaceae sp. DMI_Dod_QoI]|nr:hypothetical protein EG329_001556 [Helotiales sp. DMI_Dod_QoI]